MPNDIIQKRSKLSNGEQLTKPIPHPADAWGITPSACMRILNIWLERRRRRQTLAELVEHHRERLLDDIGVSREEALLEAAKPFWRA